VTPHSVQYLIPDLKIDVSNALRLIGDRKKVDGSANLDLRDACEMEFQPGESVRWSLELCRIAGAIEIAGTVDGWVAMFCYRCLERFHFTFSVTVREHALLPDSGNVDEDEQSAFDYVVRDGILNLEPVLRDLIALSFPARRICDEACKGLCVKCGANLNVEPCSCK